MLTPSNKFYKFCAFVLGILVGLATMLMFTGCMTRIETHGTGYTVNSDSGTKANASLSASLYARGSALETEASEAPYKTDGETWIDTSGGGTMDANANTKVGAGNDVQELESTEALEGADDELIEEEVFIEETPEELVEPEAGLVVDDVTLPTEIE